MSRRNAAILDDESGKGLGKVKKCSKGGDDKVTFVVVKEMLYAVRCLKSNEDMILALAGQFKQLSHEHEKFR